MKSIDSQRDEKTKQKQDEYSINIDCRYSLSIDDQKFVGFFSIF